MLVYRTRPAVIPRNGLNTYPSNSVTTLSLQYLSLVSIPLKTTSPPVYYFTIFTAKQLCLISFFSFYYKMYMQQSITVLCLSTSRKNCMSALSLMLSHNHCEIMQLTLHIGHAECKLTKVVLLCNVTCSWFFLLYPYTICNRTIIKCLVILTLSYTLLILKCTIWVITCQAYWENITLDLDMPI